MFGLASNSPLFLAAMHTHCYYSIPSWHGSMAANVKNHIFNWFISSLFSPHLIYLKRLKLFSLFLSAFVGFVHRGPSALLWRDAWSPPGRGSGEHSPRGSATGAGLWALSPRGTGEVQPVHRWPGAGGQSAAVPVCSAGQGTERPEHRGWEHWCWGEGGEPETLTLTGWFCMPTIVKITLDN